MINRMVLQGRLTKDPELKVTPSGVEVCSFTVAWNKEIKGVKKECFLNCVAWRQQGVFVNDFFNKGKGIIVEGELETKKYTDRDGNNRSVIELITDAVHFWDSKGSGQAEQQNPAPVVPMFEEADVSDGDMPF